MSRDGKHLFTSESVTEGHPDKIADQISDSILDALIGEDPTSRVACETMVTTGIAIIAGEITSKSYADLPQIVRDTIRDVSEALGTTEDSLRTWDEAAEQTFRLITSQYTSGECFDQLTQSWWRNFTD